MNSISVSAVSAFFSSGLQIPNSQFLQNRLDQSGNLAAQVPTANAGKVSVQDNIAGKELSVKLVPQFLDMLA